MREWIDATEELPNESSLILCSDAISGVVTIGRYIESSDEFLLMALGEMEIDVVATHWMPLPDPPGEST